MIYLIAPNLLGMLVACRKDGPWAGLMDLNQCELEKCHVRGSRKPRLNLAIKILLCSDGLSYFSLVGNHSATLCVLR